MISLEDYKSSTRPPTSTRAYPTIGPETDGTAALAPVWDSAVPYAEPVAPALRAVPRPAPRDPELDRVRDERVVAYMPLVHYVVNGLTFTLPPMLDTDDLVGYGMMGLINAVDRFDESHGVKFETYAVTRIRGYIIDQLRALDWIPRSTRQRARLIRRTRDEMEHDMGRTPTAAEVSAQLGLARAKYDLAMQGGTTVTLSLDALGHADEDDVAASLLYTVRDGASPDPGASLEAQDVKVAVTTAVSTLSEREQQLLHLYYVEERTLQEISRVLGVSESRACQIHSRALKRLRLVIAA